MKTTEKERERWRCTNLADDFGALSANDEIRLLDDIGYLLRSLAERDTDIAHLRKENKRLERELEIERGRALRTRPAAGTRHAAVSFIERSDGRILCVWNRRYGGWSMPGGLVEEGETPEAAQRRELEEETSLMTLAIYPLLYESPATQIQEGRASIVTVFRVIPLGEPREMEPGCPVTWLTRAEFLKWSPFAAFYAPLFERFPRFHDANGERT